jgi:hypothetical protein
MKPFVDRFIKEKEEATIAKDYTQRTLVKLKLNSPYGKFGTNPDSYKEYFKGPKPDDDKPWYEYQLTGEGDTLNMIWQTPAENAEYFDVAMAASITGRGRSVLWRAICGATRPMICDTDSLICEDYGALKIGKGLGEWDLEAVGDSLYIAGKKFYCLRTPKHLFDGNPKSGWKKAHKGVRVGVSTIKRVANGSEVFVKRDAPALKLDGRQVFIGRTIKRTY